MPRTKISKSSKRNREASQREEKIREYEAVVDQLLKSYDIMGQKMVKAVDDQVHFLKMRMNKKLLPMKMRDFLELNLKKFTEWTPMLSAPNSSASSASQSICVPHSLRSKVSNPNDEGYLTEDSTNTTQQQRGRTPGPLSSAKAQRTRRSKSFCGDYVTSSTKKIPSSFSAQPTEHSSRNKLRTPLASRTKAFSADRTSRICSPPSPPSAIMRWPKPGELVLSISGSPVVAQVMPDKFANVNIPVKNGVLSLQPKKLSQLNSEVLESIDHNTLQQIKTLHANLNLIMNMANKAILK